ncbi:zinc finger BED domain-containing protein 4-like [Aphomia sociella]
MSPPTQSDIWNYFKPNEHNQDKADCKICNKTYSRKGRTTSSLKNHLKSMHSEEFAVFESLSKEKQLQKIKTDADKIITPLQEAKKQLSLEEVVLKEKKWDTNNVNSKRIDKLIGEMIALQNLPFYFVEGLGFRRLIQELAPRYNFRGRHFFTDLVCKELYGKVAEKVKELIEKFDYISFTSDIWSDPSSNASLLSLTCHGIAENFDRSSIILKCETFDCRHTGDIISEKFNTMLSEWNIKKDQVHCLIRDEGSNMKRAVRLAALNDIDCTVHKIQLAIRSTIAQKQLQAIQERLNQPHLKVFQDCITRWNSTFYMFERFLKVKDALSLYINNSDINPILPEEWKIIETCIQLLKPFEEATRELSSSHALISSVIPIIQMLEKKVDDYLTRSHDLDPIRQAVTSLKNELSTKFSNLLENNLFVIATYLDPRYKHKFFTPVTEEKIKEDILMMKNTENDVYGSLNSEGAKRMRMTDSDEQRGPGTSGLVRNPCLKNDLAMMLDSSSEDESQEIPENGSVEAVDTQKGIAFLPHKKRINVDENPLKWWKFITTKKQEHSFKKLLKNKKIVSFLGPVEEQGNVQLNFP